MVNDENSMYQAVWHF